MDINAKIYRKGLTTNLELLISSNYQLCEYHNGIQFHYQIDKNKYDIVSVNNSLSISKSIIGDYFTYQVYDPTKISEHKIRAGHHGIHLILKF